MTDRNVVHQKESNTMSQKKTIVPGMENAEMNAAYNAQDQNDLYSRKTNVRSAGQGTIFPGMEASPYQREALANVEKKGGNKPVVGFLYSVSKNGAGEYWALHIGQNTIGNSSQCDIPLYEGTVSEEHAVLVVRKMKNPEKIVASISDARSTNGTMVNGESLGFSAVECFDGNIITIGESYELLLLLIDVKALGLKVSENFIAVTDIATNSGQTEQMPPSFNPETKLGNNNPPSFYESNQSYPRGGSNDGTVGLDGSNDQVRSGGTVGM